MHFLEENQSLEVYLKILQFVVSISVCNFQKSQFYKKKQDFCCEKFDRANIAEPMAYILLRLNKT